MLAPHPRPTAPSAQVVVLGMHRSGTSVLTGLLRLLGLYAGEEDDFPPADRHNEAGYWEHRGVWAVDEAILQALGATWSEIANFDLAHLGEERCAGFRERARAIVRILDSHGAWVIKDPRLCLLFPIWREVLDHPFCVLIYREPLAVARSLAKRDGISIPYGMALWERYTLEALSSTLGLPRALVSHRELMADPELVLGRLHGKLAQLGGLDLDRVSLPATEEIQSIVDPSLVHHRPEPEGQRAYLTPPQLALLEALRDGTALDLDPVPALSAGARDLLAAHQHLRATTRRLHQALSWLEELDAIVSAILESRSWRIGRALTRAMGGLLGRPRISAAERRNRLKAEMRQRDEQE